jgi:membrane protein YqaA with SNARE-associated domain
MALAIGAVRAGVAAQAFWFALVCSVGSVLGGCFGYGLGAFARPTVVDPLIRWLRWESQFARARDMYDRYDIWAVAIAGFTPIPYKIFTIAGGIARINFFRFFLASAASRSARFFLVAGFLYFFGDMVEAFIRKYFELLTLLFAVLLVGGFLTMKLVWRRKRESG